MVLSSHFKKAKFGIITLLIFICLSVLSVRQLYPISQDANSKSDLKFEIFSFALNDTNNSPIKSAFFAKDCYKSFLKLKESSHILFASSASYASSITKSRSLPVGFCAEKGVVLNKLPHQFMDALVIIHDNHPEINSMKIIDLDRENYECYSGKCDSYVNNKNIRNEPSETFSFINTIETQNISSFQTQLVYTKFKTDSENFKKLTNGTNDRSRRFLAICEKDDVLYHVIVDSRNNDYLMASAQKALIYLRGQDYEVDTMINLDTGSKDIMYALEGDYLKNHRPNPLTSSAKIENASSLLVYYTDI
ncbi:hypothetical protein [Winogradskyella schleiferi]|uniref:hypothetical protein n=1 Tax=Winogradskyella schleiferi TaxID=2686078 RepID=UPI0015BF7F7C|nr:hypothetical protein [Winogradskyella schleiferi]